MVTLLHLPSSSPLLHTSLAHLTPELIAVEGIISCPGRRPRLPTELMLIVRTHLVTALSACLAEESSDALAAYSRSLISLLCSDCTSYNTDIYGGNVFDWPWDQFSGPCLCEGDIDDCIARTQTFTDHITELQCDPASARYLFRHMELSASRRDRIDTEEDKPSFTRGLLLFNPQLLDPQFFLELFLSRKARRLARLAYKEGLKRARRGEGLEMRQSGLLKVRSIWDAVDTVLGEQYSCEVIPRHGTIISMQPVSITANLPTNSVRRAIKPTSKATKIHSKPPIEDNTAQIVELDTKDLELLAVASASPAPAMPAPFPSGLMSTTYRRERDPIYISLVPKQVDNVASDAQESGESLAHDLWATRAALLRLKHSLAFSSPTTRYDPPTSKSGQTSDRLVSGHDEVGHPSKVPPSSRPGNPDPLDIRVADSTPNYRHEHLSVPSPATKHLPVPSEPTIGITSPPATAGITEALLPVDSDAHSYLGQIHVTGQGVETAIAGVSFDPTRERQTMLGRRAVVVGDPGAEATRQINGNAPTGTTSSGSPSPRVGLGSGNRCSGFLSGQRISPMMLRPGPEQQLLSAFTLAQSLATACLCAPLAVVKVAVTVVCFYSRPQGFHAL